MLFFPFEPLTLILPHNASGEHFDSENLFSQPLLRQLAFYSLLLFRLFGAWKFMFYLINVVLSNQWLCTSSFYPSQGFFLTGLILQSHGGLLFFNLVMYCSKTGWKNRPRAGAMAVTWFTKRPRALGWRAFRFYFFSSHGWIGTDASGLALPLARLSSADPMGAGQIPAVANGYDSRCSDGACLVLYLQLFYSLFT